MPPKTDITVSMHSDLISDLEDLADINGTNRSAEISTASMIWVNENIRVGTLVRDEGYNPAQTHADARSII